MKSVAFFGGALNITDSKEYLDSIEIGKFLANKNYIVKNGGYRGLMEAVSKGAKEAGGEVIGYTCYSFGSIEGNKYLTDVQPAIDLFDRLRELIILSDMFVVQKGAFGTMAELFLTLDFIRKMKDKPNVYLLGDMWKDIFLIINNHIIFNDENIIFCDDYNDFVNKFKD
jgi:uncharacterized protein (TIGR00725 family)